MEDRTRGRGFRESLGKNFQCCPNCDQVWLIFGLKERESYICRKCGHSFILGPENSPSPLLSNMVLGDGDLNKAA